MRPRPATVGCSGLCLEQLKGAQAQVQDQAVTAAVEVGGECLAHARGLVCRFPDGEGFGRHLEENGAVRCGGTWESRKAKNTVSYRRGGCRANRPGRRNRTSGRGTHARATA
ncbi:hypothetical protein ACWDE9_42845, partial [Streptomyces olivaceoviridis]